MLATNNKLSFLFLVYSALIFIFFFFFFAMIRTSGRELNANSWRGLYLIQLQIQHKILNTGINFFVLKFWTGLCIP